MATPLELAKDVQNFRREQDYAERTLHDNIIQLVTAMQMAFPAFLKKQHSHRH